MLAKRRTCTLVLFFYLLLGNVAFSYAQSWKDILSGVAQNVLSKVDSVSSASVVGTWKYVSPDCRFQSDNLLAKAGGEIAAQKIEEMMANVFSKIGFDQEGTYVFNSDSTYTITVKERTSGGTYTFDRQSKEIQLKTRLGLKFNATVSFGLTGNTMSLLFNADKLMSLIQVVGDAAGGIASNTTLGTASQLSEQYDGLQLGFELKKE